MTGVYGVEEIKELLAPIFERSQVYRATLFGSYAKGMASQRSDVDIVIDSHGELMNIRFFGLLEDITEALNKPVDLIEASEILPDSPLHDVLREEGVLLFDR